MVKWRMGISEHPDCWLASVLEYYLDETVYSQSIIDFIEQYSSYSSNGGETFFFFSFYHVCEQDVIFQFSDINILRIKLELELHNTNEI